MYSKEKKINIVYLNFLNNETTLELRQLKTTEKKILLNDQTLPLTDVVIAI